MNQQAVGIVIAGALIASAILITNHWSIQQWPVSGGTDTRSTGGNMVRLDRWTGTVAVCEGGLGHFRDMECGGTR